MWTSSLSSGMASSETKSGSFASSSSNSALSTIPSDYTMYASSTFATVEKTSIEELSSGISMNTIIIVSAGASLFLIAMAIIITSYITRRRYKKRESLALGVPRILTSDINLIQPAGGYNNATYYSPVSPGVNAGSNAYAFRTSFPYVYNSNYLPSTSYISSNSNAIELTHRITQNVSTCKLRI
jgi:hypothetical protein